jgi:flagellar basal-body rod protein FlgB
MPAENYAMLIKNNNIFDKSGVGLYQRVLKVASSSQKLTAANIANVSTPGYSAKTISFQDEMKRSLENQNASIVATTDARHITGGSPEQIVHIKDVQGDDNASGVNNVDIEKEMTNLAENQMLYDFGAKKLARTFAMLRMAIRGKAQ